MAEKKLNFVDSLLLEAYQSNPEGDDKLEEYFKFNGTFFYCPRPNNGNAQDDFDAQYKELVAKAHALKNDYVIQLTLDTDAYFTFQLRLYEVL